MMLTQQQAFERAKAHDRRAQAIRARAGAQQAKAEQHERWAKKWRDWADDEYGEVPYPGNQ